MNKEETEKARVFFKDDRFATKTTGIEIDEVDEFYAKCSLKINEGHLSANNTAMGGCIFTLADFTFAVASNHNGEKVVSVSSSISFMSAGKGKMLYGESRLIKNGRSTCTYEINITDEMNTPVAVVIMNGMKIGKY